jgi:hypothetical protein
MMLQVSVESRFAGSMLLRSYTPGGFLCPHPCTQVSPGDALTIVVGSGGSKGIHGVTATPVNEILKRPEIKQKTGSSPGGEPGGGTGFAANSTFAAGGGGGYSAVYRKDMSGTEAVVIAGWGCCLRCADCTACCCCCCCCC